MLSKAVDKLREDLVSTVPEQRQTVEGNLHKFTSLLGVFYATQDPVLLSAIVPNEKEYVGILEQAKYVKQMPNLSDCYLLTGKGRHWVEEARRKPDKS